MLQYLKLILYQLNLPHPPDDIYMPTITSWDHFYSIFPSNITEPTLSSSVISSTILAFEYPHPTHICFKM